MIESFDTMTQYDNILNDISTNPFATPNVDIENQNIRIQLDKLINLLKKKQKQLHELEQKINKESLTAAVQLEKKNNFSGKNIFFSSMDPIGVFDLIRPVGIIDDTKYKNKILNNNSPHTLEKVTIKSSDIPNIDKTPGGFEKALYYLAMGPSKLEEIQALKNVFFPIITIPLRNQTNAGPPLFNRIKSAATMKYTNNSENANYTFRFHSQPNILNINTTAEKTMSDGSIPLNNPANTIYNETVKFIPDFNLSYKFHLPKFLMSANFISVGYNGHIYTGIDVTRVDTDNSKSFLDILINSHHGKSDAIYNTPDWARWYCAPKSQDKCPSSSPWGPLTCNEGTCVANLDSTGPQGFYTKSNYFGNQAGTDAMKWMRFIEAIARINITKYKAEIAGINSDIKKDNADINKLAQDANNPNAFVRFEADVLTIDTNNKINTLEYIENIDKAKLKGNETLLNSFEKISSIVYFGVLVVDGNIIGPPIQNKTQEALRDIFNKGGLLPVSYIGCYQDGQYHRVLETYGGTGTVDDCINEANKKGYNLIGAQDGDGIGAKNYKEGQCWFSNKSFNSFPKDTACPYAVDKIINNFNNFEKVSTDLYNQGVKTNNKADEIIGKMDEDAYKGFLEPIENNLKKMQPGMCPMKDPNYCKAGNKYRPIGGFWSNAVYQNNKAPQVKGCVLYIAGFNDINAKTAGANPGSIIYIWRENEKINTEVIWNNPFEIDRDLLIPYKSGKGGRSNILTSITNSDANNSAYGPNSEQTLNYIWGSAPPGSDNSDNKHRYLYSNDMYFRLDLSTTTNAVGSNNSNSYTLHDYFMRTKSINEYQSFFNYNTTGVLCNVNTDIYAFSDGSINSDDKRISKILDFLMKYDVILHDKDRNKSIGRWNLVYTIDPIDTRLLGKVGFIEYDSNENSNENPYNVKIYPDKNIKNIQDGPAKFIETAGTLQYKNLGSHINNPRFKDVKESIVEVDNIFTSSDCGKACFNSLSECQAYEFTKDNKCNLLKNKNSYIQDILKVQDPGILSQDKLKFNLRVPNISNTDTCPNTIYSSLVTSTLPSDFGRTKLSNIKYDKYETNAYYDINYPQDIPLCNIGKIIHTDEQLLKQYQDEIVQIANEFDSLVSSLENKEKIIYKEIFNKQKNVEDDYKTFETMHEKIKEQDKSVPDTLKAGIDNSTIHLLSSNTNFIIWTIIAIGIIIVAINLARNLKKK
tara:strand:- start:573 stop:4184 length:3612 start_codon:yes stop_codon:yes gene_type:complete